MREGRARRGPFVVFIGLTHAWLSHPLGSRVAGGISAFGRSRIRPFGLTAALHPGPRFARLASTSLPGRSAGLRSGLFWPEAKTIPPLHPSPASGRAACLLASGKPAVKTHTRECGSISSGWPPNQPASRIAKLFGEGRVSGQVGPVRAVALAAAARLENFCARQAGGCAVPDPGRFGNQTYGHATTLPWWFPEHLETPT